MYYKASGKVPFLSICVCVLIVLALVPIIAAAYTYAVWYIPTIYLNFLLTLGTGLALFVLIEFITYYFKSRNKLFDACLAILAGILLSYINWVIWIDLELNSDVVFRIMGRHVGITLSSSDIDSITAFFFRPHQLFDLATSINERGTWGIRSTPIRGTLLLFIWIMEAVILIGFAPILMLFKDTEPFCEVSKEWMEKKEAPQLYRSIENEAEMKKNLEGKNYERLLSLEEKNEPSLDYSELVIYLPKMGDVYYLTIKNIKGELIKKKNRTEYSETYVVENIEVPKEVATKLLESRVVPQ